MDQEDRIDILKFMELQQDINKLDACVIQEVSQKLKLIASALLESEKGQLCPQTIEKLKEV